MFVVWVCYAFFWTFLCGIRERARLDRHHHVLTAPDHDLGSAKGEAYNFSVRKRCVKWVLWVGKLKLKNEGRLETERGLVMLCFCVGVGGEGKKEKKWFSDGMK